MSGKKISPKFCKRLGTISKPLVLFKGKNDMSEKILAIDCSYICRRNWHATKNVKPEDLDTIVIFTFIRDMVAIADLFQSMRFVFCWDHFESKRKEIFPGYKSKKKNDDPEMIKILFKQMDKLREKILPKSGFKNHIWAYGYEADDHLANIGKLDEEVVIVTADADLYQCLSPTTKIYDPRAKTVWTVDRLIKEYNIEPHNWSSVKVLAGCSSDTIPGVGGIGTKTAIKYINKTLGEETKAMGKIRAWLQDMKSDFERNIRLVKLPLDGCPFSHLIPDKFNTKKANKQLTKRGLIPLWE